MFPLLRNRTLTNASILSGFMGLSPTYHVSLRSFLIERAESKHKNPLTHRLLVLESTRSYMQRVPLSKKRTHRLKYLFFVVVASWGLLICVTSKINKKVPKNSFTQREFESYEKETGLKRRAKLITPELKKRYFFYAVPFCTDFSKTEKELEEALNPDVQTKVIIPNDLIQKEVEEQGKYSALLEDIEARGRVTPPGLITALVKQEIQLFINTSKGQFDTNIILLNYPQSTEEAIKFENDVSDFQACVVTIQDYDDNLSKTGSSTQRKLNNVYGYFGVLNKFKKLGKDKIE